MSETTPATTETTDTPATSPSMRPVAVVFTLANAAIVATFLVLVALGHVQTNLPGVDLGLTATAAPSGH